MGRATVLFCCGNAPYNAAIAHVAAMIVNASSVKTGYGNFESRPASDPASTPPLYPAPPLSDRTMSSPRRRNRPRRRGRPASDAAQRESVGERTATPPHTMSEELSEASSASALADSASADLPAADSAADFRWPTEIGSRSAGGYKYTDLAAAPLAVVLPYSMHSYGTVQAYALGVPLLTPSQRLLAHWHTSFGMLGHKGPGNVPWRRSAERKRVPFDQWAWLAHDPHAWFTPAPLVARDAHSCSMDPNDGCEEASAQWLQFAEPHNWPHVQTFDSIPMLLQLASTLLANATRRRELSDGMKAFVRQESERAAAHARVALHRALLAAFELQQKERAGLGPEASRVSRVEQQAS